MSDRTSRRRVLYGTTAAVGFASLAGCTDGEEGDGGGDGQGGQDGQEDGFGDGTGGNETETDGDDAADDGGNETGNETGDDNIEPVGGGDGEVPPAIDEFLADANEYDGEIEDMTGEDEVTIEVGGGQNGLAFVPPAVRVGTGTTVVWEWTGEGGAHNVATVEDSEAEFRSGEPVDSDSETFELTSQSAGLALYVCEPHEAVGMLGAIEVVEGDGQGGGGQDGGDGQGGGGE